MQGAASPIRSNSGFGVLPKETKTDLDGAGFERPTLWSLYNTLYLLNNSPVVAVEASGGHSRQQRPTRVDSFLVRKLVQEAALVFDVSQVPEFNRVVDGGGRQQPIAAGVELGVGHFAFVQLVAENLHRPTTNPQNLETCKS